MDETGQITIDKRSLIPRRDMRTVETTLEELLTHQINHDYVFVILTDETPIQSPMEKVRSVYPNALHIERKNYFIANEDQDVAQIERTQLSDLELFKAFYKEVKGMEATEETEDIFKEVLDELLIDESERRVYG